MPEHPTRPTGQPTRIPADRFDDLHQTRIVVTVLAIALALSAAVAVATVLIWRDASPVLVAVAVGATLGLAAIGWRVLFLALDDL